MNPNPSKKPEQLLTGPKLLFFYISVYDMTISLSLNPNPSKKPEQLLTGP